ncbi:MAG: sucrose-6-phosphate hydrolase [Micrococcaceae bacterium]
MAETEWTWKRIHQPYMKWSAEYVQKLKMQVAKSKWRLGYHIQPETGLLNDPNGFSYFDGKWQLFYQTFPFGAVHGSKAWMHLTSSDLVNWENHGLAITPDSKHDAQGAYSGSATVVGNKLFLTYTGNVIDENQNRKSTQLGAWMTADNKVEKISNPLIAKQPAGYTAHFRDPQILKHGDNYYAIIGAQKTTKAGAILAYKAPEITGPWEYLGELDLGESNLGYMAECPNLLFIEDKPVLLFCPQGLSKEIMDYESPFVNTYVVGDAFDWENLKIINPSKIKLLDFGYECYATQGFNAPDGRVLTTGWIGLPDATCPNDVDGWSGALTLVRELRLEDGKLIQRPAKENMLLQEAKAKRINVGERLKLQSLLKWNFSATNNKTVNIVTDVKNNLSLTVSFDEKTSKIMVKREEAGGSAEIRHARLSDVSNVEVSLWLDNSVFELYINNGLIAFAGRIYPEQPYYIVESEDLDLDVSDLKVLWS